MAAKSTQDEKPVYNVSDNTSRQAPNARKTSTFVVLIISALILLTLTEWLARGSLVDALFFLISPEQPALLTLAGLAALLAIVDAIGGRRYLGVVLVSPALLAAAFINLQKQHYLTDPFYPADIFYTSQVVALGPALVAERPWTAIAFGLAALGALVLFIGLFVWVWRRAPKLTGRSRATSMAVALPVFLALSAIVLKNPVLDLRQFMHATPMMWDQDDNYRKNGLILAFTYNIRQDGMAAPDGDVKSLLADIKPGPAVTQSPKQKPDIILVMSESFWDPTRMPNIQFEKDPMPFIRSQQGGHVFSPEFGGLTANVEFEALTGFSNAFLPEGSVPYQQYIETPLPSLATFLRAEGYRTRAIHPFKSWFWNRTVVYKALGFDDYYSLQDMPSLKKDKLFADDAALVSEVIRQADALEGPFFFHVVTLQGHGPYEAHRFPQNTVKFDAPADMDGDVRESFATFVESVNKSDASMKTLMQWAKSRKRETIIVFFGDHLPALGNAYVAGGYMEKQQPERRASADDMKRGHETPLIIWSSKTGPVRNIGTISPSLLPERITTLAGLKHPYYTGVLSDVASRYDIIDRYMLESAKGDVTTDWQTDGKLDPVLAEYRVMQYDSMFGEQYGVNRFFPDYADLAQAGTKR